MPSIELFASSHLVFVECITVNCDKTEGESLKFEKDSEQALVLFFLRALILELVVECSKQKRKVLVFVANRLERASARASTAPS